MSEDFSKTPVSIGELRADRENRASAWTPREALIAVLRDIDAGKIDPCRLIIVYAVKREGGTGTHYQCSVEGNHEALGMLERAKFLINSGA